MVLISFISLYGLILSFISILLKSTQSRKTAVGCWCMWFVNHGWCRKLARVNKKIPFWLESTGSGCRKDSRRRAEVLLKTPGHWSLQIRLPVNNIQFFFIHKHDFCFTSWSESRVINTFERDVIRFVNISLRYVGYGQRWRLQIPVWERKQRERLQSGPRRLWDDESEANRSAESPFEKTHFYWCLFYLFSGFSHLFLTWWLYDFSVLFFLPVWSTLRGGFFSKRAPRIKIIIIVIIRFCTRWQTERHNNSSVYREAV